MLEVFILLFACWVLASLLPKTAERWHGIKKSANYIHYYFVYYILIIVLVCYSGLRTVMNDTGVYIAKYNNVIGSFSELSRVDLSLGANPGFECYRIILKTLGFNSNQFIFITSVFVATSFIVFLRKYSIDFSFAVFLFIASTTYAFTLAAIKQTIAVSIGIWAISALLNKKGLKFLLLIFLACTFHPYILIYLIAPIFVKNVWSKQTVLTVTAVILLGSFFGQFIDSLLTIAESIGDSYEAEFFTEGGVNALRLLVYLVTPILAFICRKKLNRQESRIINLFVNFSVISMCFMILASFGGANMFGRMANYFDVYNCLALPIVLHYGFEKREAQIIRLIAIPCYAVFYYTYYSKYGTAWNADYYRHISIGYLLKSFFGG